MNYNDNNHIHKYFSKELVELTSNFFTEAGLIDNLFLDLCRAKIDTDIRGRLVNISVIVPDKGGDKQVTVNKYFDYATRNTARIYYSVYNLIDKRGICRRRKQA